MTGQIVRLISGGQTGADRAALDVAVARDIEYGGWCPRGGRAEDRPAPPGLLAAYPRLRATDSADPAERTRLNVRDSDATLIVRGPSVASAGTDLTLAAAAELGRPVLVTAGEPNEVVDWLAGVAGAVGGGLTLNVAGPRESQEPGIYRRTRELLEAVLDRL